MEDVKLRDMLTLTRDGEWGKGEATAGFSPALVIRGTDFDKVRYGDLSTLPLRYIRSDILERKAVRMGDTLIEAAGGTKDQPTGRTVLITQRLIDEAPLPLICASFSRFLRPDATKIVPEFLFWKLQDEYHSRRMTPYHIQHTGVARFQYTQFAEKYPLYIPSLSEQQAIASVLGALDDKIELNRRMNETLEAMARAIFKDWFVDFGPTRAKMAMRGEDPQNENVARTPYLAPDVWSLFPDRLDADGKPEGWGYSTVGERFDVKIGRTPPRIEGWHFTEGSSGVPWLSIRDLAQCGAYVHETSEGLTEQSVKDCRVPVAAKDTVLVSFKLTVGRVAIAERSMATNEAIAHLNPIEGSPSSYFAYCWMKGFDYTTLGSTSSIATAVNSKSIKGMRFPEVGKQLENHFALFTEPLFKMLLNNSREARTLAQTRDLLLPKLMSGEVRVKDAERQVGEAT